MNSICENIKNEKIPSIRKIYYKIRVNLGNLMKNDPSVSSSQREKYITDTVKDICKEIRGMNKDLRNFLAMILVEVQDIPANLIIQMSEKESTFQQKFVSVGL